jgi:hypothetical protein
VDYLFCNGGTYGQNPQAWDMYKRFVRETSDDWERESSNLLGAYWQRLTCGDAEMRKAAAAAFVGYELSISKTCVVAVHSQRRRRPLTASSPSTHRASRHVLMSTEHHIERTALHIISQHLTASHAQHRIATRHRTADV